MEARGDTDVQVVRSALEKGTKEKSNNPAAFFPRTAEDEQLHQVKRMIGEIGNMLFSTCSNFKMGKIQGFLW